MPNNKELPLACVICKDSDKYTCGNKPTVLNGCKQEILSADRVREWMKEQGYLSHDEVVDKHRKWLHSDEMKEILEQAVQEERKAIGKWLDKYLWTDYTNSDLNELNEGKDRLLNGEGV